MPEEADSIMIQHLHLIRGLTSHTLCIYVLREYPLNSTDWRICIVFNCWEVQMGVRICCLSVEWKYSAHAQYILASSLLPPIPLSMTIWVLFKISGIICCWHQHNTQHSFNTTPTPTMQLHNTSKPPTPHHQPVQWSVLCTSSQPPRHHTRPSVLTICLSVKSPRWRASCVKDPTNCEFSNRPSHLLYSSWWSSPP